MIPTPDLESLSTEDLIDEARAIARRWWEADPRPRWPTQLRAYYREITRRRGGPPKVGDLICYRGVTYLVKAVTTRALRLEASGWDVRVRCRVPIAEGGFAEAEILRRAEARVHGAMAEEASPAVTRAEGFESPSHP